MVHGPAHQLGSSSGDDTDAQGHRILIFSTDSDTCVQRRQCLVMEHFIRVLNSLHSYTPCMPKSMEPRLPSSLGFYRTGVRRPTPVSLRY